MGISLFCWDAFVCVYCVCLLVCKKLLGLLDLIFLVENLEVNFTFQLTALFRAHW